MIRPDEREDSTCTLHVGDPEWHDGAGWYYIDDEYPEEGSCGAFDTWEQAADHAQSCGYERPVAQWGALVTALVMDDTA